MEKRPRVVIALIIKNKNKILLGKRKIYPCSWGFPGGKLDFGEEIIPGVLREMKEEIGEVEVSNIKFLTVTNDFLPQINEHFVSLILTADYKSGEINLMEPEKCEGWKWFSWDQLPSSLSSPLANLHKSGISPF
jgi:8-oxo-dGTP diphosphatase